MPPTTTTSSTSSSKPTKTPPSEYVETETGNRVSRRAQLHGTQHITLGGRCIIAPLVCIRADLVRPPPPPTQPSTQPQQKKKPPAPLTSITLGRYTILSASVLLLPPLRHNNKQHYPMHIGSHTFIAPHCTISAAQIGDHVVVEEGSMVGAFAILKDGCRVLRGAVVPGGMVVGAGLVVGGRPARVVGVGGGGEGEDGEVGVGWGVGEDEVGGQGGGLREVWRGWGR